jgi:hypothetical protein
LHDENCGKSFDTSACKKTKKRELCCKNKNNFFGTDTLLDAKEALRENININGVGALSII